MASTSTINSGSSSSSDTNNHVCLLGSSWSPCGYCKGARRRNCRPSDACSPNYSIYASTALTPAVYTRLVHQGWRRSGRVVYQPENDSACCPQHTLRLLVQDFTPNAHQRKLQRRLESLLHPAAPASTKATQKKSTLNKQQRNNRIHTWLRSSGTLERLQQQTLQAIRDCEPVCDTASAATTTAAAAAIMDTNKVSTATIPHFKLLRYDTAESIVVLSCASLRGQGRATAVAQQLEVTANATPSGTLQVSLSVPTSVLSTSSHGTAAAATTDKVQSWWNQQQHHSKESSPSPPLTVRTLPAEESALDARVHQLYWDYQTKVHKDPHPLHQQDAAAMDDDDNDADDDDDDDKNKETNRLENPRAWVMVQETYGDNPPPRIVAAVAQFWDFLVASPLLLQEDSALTSNTKQKISSATYHQQYWMGDILIAVSVLDVLANDGVSSVYCFYDSTFPYPLGSLAILYEITYHTRDALKLPWYYLGYYIESCPKMNYKGSYAPSQLLCRSTHTWVDLQTVARPRLLVNDTCVLFGETRNESENRALDAPIAASRPPPQRTANGRGHAINGLRLSVHGTPCRFQQLPIEAQNELRPHIERWMRNAGEEVATRCVLDFRAGG